MSDIFGKISIEAEKSDTPKKRQKKNTPRTPPQRKAGKRQFPSSNLFWLILPMGLICLYSIIGFWGVPYYLSTSIPELAAKEYKVDVFPGKITFNPFNFTLKTESAKIDDQQGQSIASLPFLELNFAPIQLLRMDFVCTKVTMRSPSLHFVRDKGGAYNFSTFIPNFKKNTNNAGMIVFSDLPFSFSLNNITVDDGTLTFEDKPNQKTHKVDDIVLQLPTVANIDFQADDYITPYFSAVVNGSPVTFKGETSDKRTSDSQSPAQLTWEMKDFPLQEYVSYLPFSLPFSINKGTVAGTVGLRFDALKKDGKLSINFTLDIANIDFETQQKTLQLQSPEMAITGSFSPVKKLFTVDELRLATPQFTARTQYLLKELTDIFIIQKKKNALGIIEEPIVFSLRSLEFGDGKLSQEKTGNKNEVATEWVKLAANIQNYTTHEPSTTNKSTPSSVHLTGQTAGGTNIFAYTGSFVSPSTLSGKLSVTNITCQDLFTFVLPQEDSSGLKGSATFDSIFSITEQDDRKTFSSSFTQTNITLKNLKITDKDKPVFQAEEVSLADAELTEDKKSFGIITVTNASTSYIPQGNSSIIAKIISGQYSIAKLTYTGDITLQPNNTKALPFILKNASLKYSGKHSTEKNENNLSITGLTDTDGKIDATGELNQNPFGVTLSTNFTHVDNSTLTTILGRENFVTNTTGTISGNGDIIFPENAFTGNLSLTNGKYSSGKDRTFSWDKFDLENVQLTTKPYQFTVASIKLNKPKFSIPIEPNRGSMDQQLSDFFRKTLHNQKESSQSPIDIQKITISNGELILQDYRLKPAWIGELRNLNGTIDNIHSASATSHSPFSFTGTFDGSDFTWKGSTSPFKNTQTDKHQFTLTNYPLNNFAQQLHPLSDINFRSSTISLTYSSDWLNGDLSHSARSIISNLKIDTPKSESALPLALLANEEGTIEINSTAIENSSYRDKNLFDELIGEWQKRMVKGSISPLLLLKGNFSDLIDNNYIDFKPGQFMLSDEGRKTLLRYGALLVAHPNIKLKLSGGISLEEDKNSLHKQLEKNETYRVEKENEKLFAKWQSKKKEYESQLNNNQQKAASNGEIAESNIPAKVLAGFRPLLPVPVVVDNEMLMDLAEKRLDIVKQHFMTQLSLTKGRIEVPVQGTRLITKNSHEKGVHIEIMPFESSVLFQHEQD